MKKYLSVFIFVSMLLPCGLRAEGVPADRLVRMGITAFRQRVHSDADVMVKQTCFCVEAGDTLLAILNFQDGGFIVMGADDACVPVWAYSPVEEFNMLHPAPGAMYWLGVYRQQIASAKKQHLSAAPEIAAEWQALSAKAGRDHRAVVAPLLLSKWNQSKYYNDLCPEDVDSPDGYGGHVPCGCVALAMATVIHYYRYPETGHGWHTYHSDYGWHTVSYTGQTYNYDAMPYVLNKKCNAAAKLIYHCGIAVNMNYTPEGSGAQTESTRDGLVNYYKYDNEAVVAYRDRRRDDRGGYGTAEWIELLKEDLDLARPIIYSGYNEEGGHAFVCDGYDSDDLFHFNFGWGGTGNGYYTVAENENNAAGGFHGAQMIVCKIHPPAGDYPEYCNDRIIMNTYGSLEDGSGNFDYQNNVNCTRIISPTNCNYVLVSVQEIETQENHDFLQIWDGNPDDGGILIHTASGNTCIPSVWFRCNSGSAYIVFTSDDSTTGAGWRIIYTARRHVQCNSTQILTDPIGHIEDGSGAEEYASDATCYWIIRPPQATYVNLHFTDFELSPEDYVKVYDGEDISTASLLGRFTGRTVPNNLTSGTGVLKVEFISDNYLQSDGFAADYTSDGIEEYTAIGDHASHDVAFDVFPNPAATKIRLDLPAAFRNGDLRICDMTGRSLRTMKISDLRSPEISVSDLSTGIYLITIGNSRQMVSKKLIIQR